MVAGWRKLHSEVNDQVKEHEMWGHVARMREKRNKYRILVGKPDRKKPLGRQSWEDNIKRVLREIELGGME
jgi:hypothetical protein